MSHPHLRPHDRLMIRRVRSSLKQYTDGLLVQFHVVSLECQIRDPRNVLLAVAEIVLKEEREATRRVE